MKDKNLNSPPSNNAPTEKKVRCERGSSQCLRCKNDKVECHFVKATKKRGPLKKSLCNNNDKLPENHLSNNRFSDFMKSIKDTEKVSNTTKDLQPREENRKFDASPKEEDKGGRTKNPCSNGTENQIFDMKNSSCSQGTEYQYTSLEIFDINENLIFDINAFDNNLSEISEFNSNHLVEKKDQFYDHFTTDDSSHDSINEVYSKMVF
ncbi:16621_t:CDS:2 [Acaulospora morrowiae]|uniref:16621_t:CDS:1 n=1 Tax=Acaulospora morrowiae TaxID=94023 RepID=A0A9N9FZN7_9GLOM|nr:16621_t:CDS:2 [Acaulospora morrowiae]